jgi:hypothetical protein
LNLEQAKLNAKVNKTTSQQPKNVEKKANQSDKKYSGTVKHVNAGEKLPSNE